MQEVHDEAHTTKSGNRRVQSEPSTVQEVRDEAHTTNSGRVVKITVRYKE